MSTLYTDAVLDRCAQLRSKKVPWRDIGVLLGLPHDTLKTRYYLRNYNRNLVKAEDCNSRAFTRYTEADLAKAAELKDLGHRWRDIAQVMGRPERSLITAVSRWRRGKQWTERSERLAVRRKTIIALAEKGTPIPEIARALNEPYLNTYMSLKYYGFDAQLIAEFREAA